jgi:hypothetical protein
MFNGALHVLLVPVAGQYIFVSNALPAVINALPAVINALPAVINALPAVINALPAASKKVLTDQLIASLTMEHSIS